MAWCEEEYRCPVSIVDVKSYQKAVAEGDFARRPEICKRYKLRCNHNHENCSERKRLQESDGGK